jgi:hypothetical protein
MFSVIPVTGALMLPDPVTCNVLFNVHGPGPGDTGADTTHSVGVSTVQSGHPTAPAGPAVTATPTTDKTPATKPAAANTDTPRNQERITTLLGWPSDHR